MTQCPLINECYVFRFYATRNTRKAMRCLSWRYHKCKYYQICQYSKNVNKCTFKLFISAFKKALGEEVNESTL